MPVSNWNDGPGDSPKRRGRIGFLLKVREVDEHWAWTGPRNFLGKPTFRTMSGAMLAAHLVAWELFRNKRVPSMEQVCDREDCVRPDQRHWRVKR